MSTPHTPGPWSIGYPPHGDCRIYAPSATHAIARTYGQELNGIGTCELTGPKNRADARLIAAAPNLLACLIDARDDVASELQRCREAAGYPSTDRRLAAQEALLERVDAAISAATGENNPC